MYRLRQLDVDDKVCEQVDLALVEKIYPKEVIIECIEGSPSWTSKRRRVRQTTPYTLVWLLIGMALWSRLNQWQVWQKLVGKLSIIHPGKKQGKLSDSGISGRRKDLGSEGLEALRQKCCVVIADPRTMPSAFFGRYRLLAIDGTVFNTPDTRANDEAFGRSSNQYGKGAYPQVRCVLLVECGTHAVIGLHMSRYDVSEVHGAHHLLAQIGPNMLLTVDAGITSGGLFERARAQRAHVLGALETGTWEKLAKQRRLSDGSVLAWVPPSKKGAACYPVQQGIWVRIISYRLTDERLGEEGKVYRLVTTLLNPKTAPALTLVELYHERWEIELVIDEIKTHERMQRKVLRSKTPQGIKQELQGVFLAHYLVRALMAQAALTGEHDPDRLSFTEGLFQVTEMIDLALLFEPEAEATASLLVQLQEKLVEKLLPPRTLRINRREVKQVYNKYKPKKRNLPPPDPFKPDDRFLDFVALLDPLAPPVLTQKGA
jgi:hypothetical protein